MQTKCMKISGDALQAHMQLVALKRLNGMIRWAMGHMLQVLLQEMVQVQTALFKEQLPKPYSSCNLYFDGLLEKGKKKGNVKKEWFYLLIFINFLKDRMKMVLGSIPIVGSTQLRVDNTIFSRHC